MNIVEEAFQLLYPEKELDYQVKILYSGRFKDYNANVKMDPYRKILEFRLCRKWREVSKEIQIGLIQELTLKILNKKKESMYIDLYNNFVKNLHLAIPKTRSHPILEDSFNRVNEEYFYHSVEQPNLVWGTHSKTKLGSYDYKTDEISISKVFLDLDPKLLDYVMYHELLHKKHKYKTKAGGKNRYHHKEFRESEREFEDQEQMEKQLTKELRKVKIKSFFSWK